MLSNIISHYFRPSKSIIVSAIFLLLSFKSFCQIISKPLSITGQAGISNFLGDLGGSYTRGQRGFVDLDVQTLGYVGGATIRLGILKNLSVKGTYTHSIVRGDDAFSENPDRAKRNLSFKSRINEITGAIEYTIFKKYNPKNKTENEVNLNAGLGVFYFNPQAKLNGVWYDLQPLGTEGQGLKPGTAKYSRTSMTIPLGINYYRTFYSKHIIGLEVSFRKSFTDYIDDVSTQYYDNATIARERGAVAAALADRNLKMVPIPEGSRRGNPKNKDNFTFFMVSYGKNITLPKRKPGNRKMKCYKFREF